MIMIVIIMSVVAIKIQEKIPNFYIELKVLSAWNAESERIWPR